MICGNIQKYTKIQASVQHGLYLFTCEISSVNSRRYLLRTYMQRSCRDLPQSYYEFHNKHVA